MKEINSLAKELKGVFGWHQARVTLLAQFILALVKVRSVNLTRIAHVFYGTTLPASNYKRLQRFLRDFTLDYDQCARVMARWFCSDETWVLCLDRTNWNFGVLKINFMVLAVAHEGVAIPLFWVLLPKKGNSNTEERKALINRFLSVFGVDKIAYLTADREFRGKNWLQFLVDEHIPFCIRIPNNTNVWNKHRNQRLPVSRLFGLQRNEQMSLKKQRDIWGIPVHLSCIMGKQGRVIIATNEQPETAIRRYAIRWSIETLFGCLKSRGFDLESTHLQDLERLEKLFFVCALALAWSFKLGIWQNSLKPLKLKKHGRKSKSLFRLGLDYLHRILVEGNANLSVFWHSLKVLSCT
ncbi:IS4 family transposase [Zooshikella ganghwensis]